MCGHWAALSTPRPTDWAVNAIRIASHKDEFVSGRRHNTHTHTHTHIQRRAHTHPHTSHESYTNTHPHTGTHAHAHTQTRTHTHTHTHTVKTGPEAHADCRDGELPTLRGPVNYSEFLSIPVFLQSERDSPAAIPPPFPFSRRLRWQPRHSAPADLAGNASLPASSGAPPAARQEIASSETVSCRANQKEFSSPSAHPDDQIPI